MIFLMVISPNSYGEAIGFDVQCDSDCLGYGFTESECMLICSFDPNVDKPVDQACYNKMLSLGFIEGHSKYHCQ